LLVTKKLPTGREETVRIFSCGRDAGYLGRLVGLKGERDMEQRIGSCSLCGGDVRGFVGVWMGVTPPLPPRCTGCGARPAGDVIEMRKP